MTLYNEGSEAASEASRRDIAAGAVGDVFVGC